MDPNTQFYYQSALKLKLPVVENEIINGFNLTLGNKNYYFFNKITPNNNGVSTVISANKNTANRLLKSANIPVPKGRVIEAANFDYDQLITITSELKFPLVVKPLMWSGMGDDVVCNILNMATLFNQCESLLKKYAYLLIEEYHGNLQDYRILVFQNKILDVLERFPAKVVGNGHNTIQELVQNENAKRIKISNILAPIVFDYEANLCLQKAGLTFDSIPEKGKKIDLGFTCNSSRGGSLKSLPNTMYRENKKLFLKVAKLLNLELVGIDVKCKNLHEPITLTGGVIIEANYCPSIRIHEEGLGGVKKNVTKTIMKSFIYKHPISYFLHLCSNLLFRKHIIVHLFFLFVVVLFVLVSLTNFINSKYGTLWQH